MVFAACDWGETAREDEGLKNDIYTHFLIEGLNGSADRNIDGAVTATEAHDYARRRTYALHRGAAAALGGDSGGGRGSGGALRPHQPDGPAGALLRTTPGWTASP